MWIISVENVCLQLIALFLYLNIIVILGLFISQRCLFRLGWSQSKHNVSNCAPRWKWLATCTSRSSPTSLTAKKPFFLRTTWARFSVPASSGKPTSPWPERAPKDGVSWRKRRWLNRRCTTSPSSIPCSLLPTSRPFRSYCSWISRWIGLSKSNTILWRLSWRMMRNWEDSSSRVIRKKMLARNGRRVRGQRIRYVGRLMEWYVMIISNEFDVLFSLWILFRCLFIYLFPLLVFSLRMLRRAFFLVWLCQLFHGMKRMKTRTRLIWPGIPCRLNQSRRYVFIVFFAVRFIQLIESLFGSRSIAWLIDLSFCWNFQWSLRLTEWLIDGCSIG